MSILMTVGLFLSLSFAQADMTTITQELNKIRIENEAATRPLEDERIKLDDEKTLLEARMKEIEDAKNKAQKPVETKIDSETLNSILLNSPMGKCKIRAGTSEREYIISNDNYTLRMIFAPFDSSNTPVAHPVKAEMDGLLNVNIIEVEQKKFTPERVENPGEMSATIRFEPETLRVIHATFRGQKLNDQMLGWSSSYAVYQLSCVL